MPDEQEEQLDPLEVEKAAVFQQMQEIADEFTARGVRTRRAYRDGQHQGHVSTLAAEARKRYDEIAGEQGESDDGDDTGTTGDDGTAAEHEPRSDSNAGGTRRG